MMRYEPTLIVRRLIIKRNDLIVYDEAFHAGVNVIRGENSSGKSTVLNFIFYGLGGDLNDWSTVARLCTRVIVEVQINGNSVTLSREISEKSGQQPMEIFGGDYVSSQAASVTEWIRYPYRSSENRESFSQALFRLMGIPEVSSDLSGHITIHQVLRLLYADQLSPVEDIFRFERFDQANLRDTIGRLLCGVYDSSLYDNDQKIRELTKEHDMISGELKSLFSVLENSGQGLTPEWIQAERNKLKQEQTSVLGAIEQAERHIYVIASADEFTLTGQNDAFTRVQTLQTELGNLRRERDTLALGIADSNEFIASLQNKIEALQDSSKTAELIGEIQFQCCPACYAPITEFSAHICHLCKTPFDAEQTHKRIAALIMEAGLQIKQSEQLQSRRLDTAKALDKRIQELEANWRNASHHLASLQRLPSNETQQRLRNLQRQSGYIDRQIEDLEQKERLVELIHRLTEQKDSLNREITRLKSANDILRTQQQERLSIAYTRISDELKELLRNDLRRQDIFEDPRSATFTFAENRISIDNESYFSASSRAILKSSFFLAFLAAATKTSFFRHPRFCMIDTLENMGIEAIRSQNFQLQILRVSKESKVEHQIIYATAMIEPQLEEAEFTVGAFSTLDNLTIDIRL